MSIVQKIFYDLPTVADVLSISESTVKDVNRWKSRSLSFLAQERCG